MGNATGMSSDRRLGNDRKSSERVRLPLLDVRGVHSGGIRNAIRAFYDGGEQDVERIVGQKSAMAPIVERRAGCIYPPSVFVGGTASLKSRS